jgi:hypothetical protein
VTVSPEEADDIADDTSDCEQDDAGIVVALAIPETRKDATIKPING